MGKIRGIIIILLPFTVTKDEYNYKNFARTAALAKLAEVTGGLRSSIASTSLFSDVHHSDAGHIEMLSGSSRKCTKFCRSDLENETGAVADYFFGRQ